MRAVAVHDDPKVSTVRYEVGLYGVLAVYIVPLLFFAAYHTLSALQIRVRFKAACASPLSCFRFALLLPTLTLDRPLISATLNLSCSSF